MSTPTPDTKCCPVCHSSDPAFMNALEAWRTDPEADQSGVSCWHDFHDAAAVQPPDSDTEDEFDPYHTEPWIGPDSTPPPDCQCMVPHLCETQGYCNAAPDSTPPPVCGAGGCTNTNPPVTDAEKAKCFYDGSPCQRSEPPPTDHNADGTESMTGIAYCTLCGEDAPCSAMASSTPTPDGPTWPMPLHDAAIAAVHGAGQSAADDTKGPT